jgi:hypothetical protein
MQTLEKFLGSSGISMSCQEVTPNLDNELLITEPWRSRQFACELHGRNGDPPITAIIGSDDEGPPGIVEVLDVLAAEAAVVEEAESFEDWAVGLGYDPGSPLAKRIYRHERVQAQRLRQLLGDASFRQLLWDTERL